MFSGRHILPLINNRIFVDRNPKIFMHVIDFLRNNKQLPKMKNDNVSDLVSLEMKFWGLNEEVEESKLNETLNTL